MNKTNLIKVSDLIADILVKNNITTVFSVVGGSSMHLNHSFSNHNKLNVIYNHHEQASAISAEAFYKSNQEIAAVCVSSGPGGTNAITGVLCAYMDSIPMIIISGQVRKDISISKLNPKLRFNGEQEHHIINTIKNLTKFSFQLVKASDTEKIFSKAIYFAKEGRPGPVWVDIPLDVQAQIIRKTKISKFIPLNAENDFKVGEIDLILDKILKSSRPLIHVGASVRYTNAIEELFFLASRLNIPITTGMGATDIINNDSALFAGRPGITGDRVGNYAIQSCDLLISIGSRLGYRITGYNTEEWAINSYKIMINIDENELNRDYLKINLKIKMDVKQFLSRLSNIIKEKNVYKNNDLWLEIIKKWKTNYLTFDKKFITQKNERPNIYYFFDRLSEYLSPSSIVVTTAGTSRLITRQSLVIKDGIRLISNNNTATMGYDLPASIGVAFANINKPIILIASDGGINMNIQELQTIRHYKLPIKIFIINNNGYHSIRTTQNSFFPNSSLHGVGGSDNTLSFPNFKKLSLAYGIDYTEIKYSSKLHIIREVLNMDGPIICQIFVDEKQVIEPKGATLLTVDGKLDSLPLDNMKPFLDVDEVLYSINLFKKN